MKEYSWDITYTKKYGWTVTHEYTDYYDDMYGNSHPVIETESWDFETHAEAVDFAYNWAKLLGEID